MGSDAHRGIKGQAAEMLGLQWRVPPLEPRSGFQRGSPKRKAEHEPSCCRVAAAKGRQAAIPFAAMCIALGRGKAA